MNQIETNDPDILKFRTGGGCLMIFGLPFLLTGLFVLSIPFELLPLKGTPPPLYVAIPFGAVFFIVGFGLMFGRKTVTLDRRRRRLVTEHRALVPLNRKEVILEGGVQVALSKEVRRGNNSTTTVYPINIVSDQRGVVFCVGEESIYETGRQTGELIATFLYAPLSDSVSGKNVVREADELNISIREQAKRSGTKEPLPAQPPMMRSRVREEVGEIVVEIPRPKMSPFTVVEFIIPLVFIMFAFFMFRGFIADSTVSPAIRYGFVAFLVVFMIIIPIGGALRKSARTSMASCVVTANRAFLRVERGVGQKKESEELPADQIEELELVEKDRGPFTDRPDGGVTIPGGYTGGRSGSGAGNQVVLGPKAAAFVRFLGRLSSPGHIVARSDQKTITFGQGLEPEELRYIHGLVKRELID